MATCVVVSPDADDPPDPLPELELDAFESLELLHAATINTRATAPIAVRRKPVWRRAFGMSRSFRRA
jgi:hypothetical protein